ncbi:uncharacterized protein LOC103931341 [Pyrus x bretschneideri]|uniref:uncharacterized protein LOC103931341 n=1 Tax=Pyrus x bretschneideri TaxID=225117 RepID=UPI00202DEBD4|nr:uncharacterized protein LOC103931341 [Pyrus x bretschneideri]
MILPCLYQLPPINTTLSSTLSLAERINAASHHRLSKHCASNSEHRRFELCNRWQLANLNMSLACLVCSVESPSHSFRSYSVSSTENDGRCSAIANCLTRRPSLPLPRHSNIASSKVTPQPTLSNSGSIPGTPRLVRSRAVRRDIVRDWNFDEVVMGH